MLMTASRTIEAFPGIRSAALTHFVSVTLVGRENSETSSITSGVTVFSTSIGILRSGGPSFHFWLNVTSAALLRGRPAVSRRTPRR